MKPEKQTLNVLRVRAIGDASTPIRYENQTVRITNAGIFEFDKDKIPYESMIHINQAIEEEILEIVQDKPKAAEGEK